MKKIYIILLVVVLLGGFGGLVFFIVKKKKDSDKTSSETPKTPTVPSIPTAPITESKASGTKTNEKAALSSKIINPTPVKESIEMDISVPYVDTQNRRFDYSMHYKGIPYKGVFQDGLSGIIQVEKSFGAFLITQAMQAGSSVSTKAGAQKVRNGKGAAAINKTSSSTAKQNDFVGLSIIDNNNNILKHVTVNLATGEISNSNLDKPVIKTLKP